jgi:hypothetical protein
MTRAHSFLLISSIVLLSLYVWLALAGNWNTQIPRFLTIYLICFGVYGLCLFWLFKGRLSSVTSVWILLPAVLFRLTLIWCEPALSEDFYRYRWDGLVQISGHGPYDFPPDAPELEPLRDQYYERINHKAFKTPYSAAAESLYHLFARISTSVPVFKSFIVAFDLLLLETIRRLLKKESRNDAWLLVYAWHPLPIVEFAGSGHMDVLGIAFLFVSYLLLYNRFAALSGITFAAAVLTKYLPVLVFPWLARTRKWRFFVAGGIAALFLMLQYYSPDLKMFSGALSYYKKWRFNDSLFGFLYSWLGGAEPARVAGMLITLGGILFSLKRGFNFYRGAFVAFGSVMLLSPVVHPWYLCWILPLLVFHPNKPWIFLCGWIVLAYMIRHLFPVGVWKPVLWLSLLVYAPFYAWLLFDFIRGRLVQTAPSTSPLLKE